MSYVYDASVAAAQWIEQQRPAFLNASQFWYLCLTPVLVAAAMAALPGRSAKRSRSNARQAGFLGLVFIVLVMMRLPFFCRDALNPDEAFIVSSAMRLTVDPVAYRSADTGTNGPLNAYLLTMPALFGGELSYVAARLTGMALMFGTIVAVWLTYRLLVGRRLASLLAMPFFVCIACFSGPDFIHFSSEQLPVFLSAVILCLLAFESTRKDGSSLWPLAAAGALASAMVFSKFQSVPTALVLLSAAFCLALRRGSKRAAVGWLAFGTAALPGFLLTLFYRAGAATEFWYSYVGRNVNYSSLAHIPFLEKAGTTLGLLFSNPDLKWYAGGLLAMAFIALADEARTMLWPRSGASSRWISGLTAGSGALMLLSTGRLRAAPLVIFDGGALLAALVLVAARFFGVGAGLSLPRRGTQHRHIRPPAAAVAGFAAIFLATAAFTVGKPGNYYPHYGFFYLVPLGFFTVTAGLWFFERSHRRLRWRIRSVLTVCFLILTCGIPLLQKARAEYPTAMEAQLFNPRSRPLSVAIGQHASRLDGLVVWGWNSQLYVETGIVPGTRFADSVMQIEPSPHIDYFRKTYLMDFTRSMPAVFVDAVAPGAFRYDNRAEMGFETFPELRQVIEGRYRLLTEIQGSRVFVRQN